MLHKTMCIQSLPATSKRFKDVLTAAMSLHVTLIWYVILDTLQDQKLMPPSYHAVTVGLLRHVACAFISRD